MKIAAVQFSPEYGNKERNLDFILSQIDSIDADLIVFPELSTTGYFFLNRKETANLAEAFGGPAVNAMSEKAEKQNKIIVAGFIESAGEKIFNSAAILFPDNKLNTVYRKTHLFYKERFCFDAGDTGFFVIDSPANGLKLGTMICYDWRFPEAARTLALKGADLIVCPSNLVTNVWHISTPSRALENKVYFAVANRTGNEERNGEELHFNGKSMIYGYNGEVLSGAGTEADMVIYADIEPANTRNKSFNEFNDIFTDRRPDMYE